MALFGKLFDKKQCSICGDDIGLLGNRKLEDGNCCKNCAAKLSPWFSERRQSTWTLFWIAGKTMLTFNPKCDPILS